MNAQVIYDLREKYEFCSGTDLHEFFDGVVGEPSPSGKARVPKSAARSFVTESFRSIRYNSSSQESWCNDSLNHCLEAMK